ncbi:hypothetical protein evm_001639 [Chilo suppressalis]|nr:hypothetical protein evm_001639 [Chilo suppressalis]
MFRGVGCDGWWCGEGSRVVDVTLNFVASAAGLRFSCVGVAACSCSVIDLIEAQVILDLITWIHWKNN